MSAENQIKKAIRKEKESEKIVIEVLEQNTDIFVEKWYKKLKLGAQLY